MSVANPIPRQTRRQTIITGAGQLVFGPTTFKVYDPLDVAVFARDPASSLYVRLDAADFTATLTGPAPAPCTVTLDTARPTGASLRLDSRRTHERLTDVTRSGTIHGASMETELDKQTTLFQELRRDVDEALQPVEGLAAAVTAAENAAAAAADDAEVVASDRQAVDTAAAAVELDRQAAQTAANNAANVVANHVALADPHTQYELEAQKNQPNGYVGLSADSKIEEIYLPAYLTGGGIVVPLSWYDTPALARSAGSQAAAWNVAVALAVATKRRLVIRGRAGAESWAALPNIELPAGLQIESDWEPGIAQLSPFTGDFLRWRSRPYMRGRLKLDGGVTLQTIAGGLVMGHVGMCVAVRRNGEAGAGYGTRIYDGVLEAVEFQNFGEGGLETYFYTEPRIHSELRGIRLGAFGEIHNSPLNGRCRNGYYDNIFPGYASTSTQAYERNAYGVSGTHWTGDDQPQDWEFNGYEIRRVTSWESGDFHGAKNCGFVNCKSYLSSQGFVFENHVNGLAMRDCYVRGCSHFGYGTSSTRDSLIMYSLGGIICNATGTDPTPYGSLPTVGVDISDVTLKDCGETRIHSTLGALSGGAAIVMREMRSAKISDARIFSAYQAGISFTGQQTEDAALYCDIDGVLIDGVVSHASTQRGVQIGSWCLGRAANVHIQGIATKAQAFYQVGSPQYLFHFGKIGGSTSTQGTDFQNYAVGAS